MQRLGLSGVDVGAYSAIHLVDGSTLTAECQNRIVPDTNLVKSGDFSYNFDIKHDLQDNSWNIYKQDKYKSFNFFIFGRITCLRF